MTNWIKCSERLPEDGVGVLAWWSGGCVKALYDPRPKEWKHYDYLDMRLSGVTHWQPLPEAPNEN